MSNHVFLITGGGSGAKLAEAFVHVCAAGLGPDEAHVLLVDADTDNGNLDRAERTFGAYERMAKWKWSAATSVRAGLFGHDDVGTRLFATRLHLYRLTRSISTVKDGGIRNAVGGDGLGDVLDLFYDASEQAATCEDGFKARPNLGCLLMSNHLAENLGLEPESRAFVKALVRAESAGAGPVPVVVAASVFGGTGASLLPVARRRFEEAMAAERGGGFQREAYRWSAVKLLPYYQPKRRKDGVVDPERFPLDAANALQFYSAVYDADDGSGYDALYVVGSDRPARNQPSNQEGRADQSNPAYFEELVAALAVRDAAGGGAPGGGRGVGVLVTGDGQRPIQWADLPDGETARERFAYLLHLAAFYLRRGQGGQLAYGLRQLLTELGRGAPEDLTHFRWYDRLLDPWASNFDAYASAGKSNRPAVLLDPDRLGAASVQRMVGPATEYLGRLMLWAETALEGNGLALVDYVPNGNYAPLYNEMNRLKKGDVDEVLVGETTRSVQPHDDNGLVRLFRAATVAMLRQRDSGRDDVFSLYGPQSGRVELAVSRAEVFDALKAEGLQTVEGAYTKTAAPTAT